MSQALVRPIPRVGRTTGYKRLVLAGAIEHGLPAATIAAIRAAPSQDDPMPHRRTKLEAEEALAASGIVVD